MFLLESPVTLEQTIKKSRFIATALPVSDEETVKASIAAHSDPRANHNCWAWRIGATYRFNDDGEPGGTAGKPILQAIDGQSLDRTLVIVARWFGGVLLGTGGLARAYGGTAAACLRTGTLLEQVAALHGTIRVGFADLALLKARITGFGGASILAETFRSDGAEIAVSAPKARFADLARLIADCTSGRSSLKEGED
ncbi:IMPACT family member YigZ [Labrys miyagiensis]